MIDTHCHLDFDAFDGRRDATVSEANAAGVHTLITIGVDLQTSQRAVELSEKYDSVYATVGVHPHDARKLDDRVVTKLKELAERKRVVAIGEIGLDFYRDLSPRQVQKEAFHEQLELAIATNLPVVIHTREAFEETVTIVEEYADKLAGGVFHCFPGNAADARRVFDLGFVVSVGGVLTYKNSGMGRMAAEVPLDKILLETDSPYLTPVPFRGKKNCPAYVSHVRDKLAELRGISPAEVEKATDRTARKLFRLVETFEG
jgi:TatD DNase family protein